jgi:hypothetical protein
MNKAITLIALLLLFSVAVQAQQEDPLVAELLENFFRSNESAGESDVQLFLENLERLQQRPIDLNTATRDELLATQIINALQIEQLLNYREKLGNLLNIYELQAVPGWEINDIRRLQPFVQVNGGLDRRGTPLYKGILKGTNEVLFRVGIPDPPNYTGNVEGDPYTMAFRYKHNYDNRVRYGFTAEKDAGEAIFAKSNPNGFDFYSAHLFIQNTGGKRIKALALGDFSARMGQGVLLQTGFSPGKSAESVTLLRGARRLNAYSAFGESFFLRGAGATVRLSRRFELTAFASYRQRDANLDISQDTTDLEPGEILFTSLQTSGLHRTASEIADERKIKETLGGATLSFLHRHGQISANALYLHYNRPFNPSEAPYRLYSFRGEQLVGMSIDHQWTWRNFLLFGENARSDNGGLALLNGIMVGGDRRVTMSVVHRHYEPQYQSVYGSPFGEVSAGANEDGLYTGIEIRPSKPWKINAYADLWRHPWLRFGIDGPSRGQEYLMRMLWQPIRTFQTYVIWQTETKSASAPYPESGLVPTQRERLRVHAGYKVSPGLEMRSRVEWIFYKKNKVPSKGFLIYQEALIKPRNFPVSGAFRYAIFETDSYDSRVYSFENDLFAAVSIPGFAGRGNRFYVNLTWRISKKWRLEGRFETTYLQRAVTTGSIPGRENIYKIQVRGGF